MPEEASRHRKNLRWVLDIGKLPISGWPIPTTIMQAGYAIAGKGVASGEGLEAMQGRREAKAIRISENAKALLRDLGWTDEKIEAVLQKPPEAEQPRNGTLMGA